MLGTIFTNYVNWSTQTFGSEPITFPKTTTVCWHFSYSYAPLQLNLCLRNTANTCKDSYAITFVWSTLAFQLHMRTSSSYTLLVAIKTHFVKVMSCISYNVININDSTPFQNNLFCILSMFKGVWTIINLVKFLQVYKLLRWHMKLDKFI